MPRPSLRLLSPLLALAILATSSATLLASDAGPDDTPAAVELVDAGAEVPAAGAAATPDLEEPTPAELLAQVTDLQRQLAAARAAAAAGDDDTKRLAIFGALASGTWLLIGGLKFTPRLGPVWKRNIPLVVAGLSIVAALFGGLAGGMTWANAIMIGAGPTISVFLHELKDRLFKDAPAPA